MTFIVVIILLIVAAIAYSTWSSKRAEEVSSQSIQEMTDFVESSKYETDDHSVYFGVDSVNNKVMFASVGTKDFRKKLVDNVNSSIVVEDIKNGSALVIDTTNNQVVYGFVRPQTKCLPHVRVVNDFHASSYYLQICEKRIFETRGSIFMATDNDRKLILLGNTANDHFLISYKNIIKFEIVEDGETTIERSLGGVIGRSVVGGLVAGNAGAVIGGTTSSAKNKKKVKNISVKILLRNSDEKSISLPIYNSSSPTDCSNQDVVDAMKAVEEVKDTLSIIIDEVERSEKQTAQAPKQENSLAEELAKLAEMKNAGIISDEEFSAAKAKLLG